VCTPTGKPAQMELWAMPVDDEAVTAFYERTKGMFESPSSLAEVVRALADSSPYIAVFVPGGHGAMLGLPDNADLGKLLRWAVSGDRFVLTLCHGPAALLSAKKKDEANPDAEQSGKDDNKDFIFNGYSMAVFPDKMDAFTPLIGYMPGRMPWYFGERLAAEGVTIVNSMANGTTHRDRNLVTGDSPAAANAFGRLAADTLLESVK